MRKRREPKRPLRAATYSDAQEKERNDTLLLYRQLEIAVIIGLPLVFVFAFFSRMGECTQYGIPYSLCPVSTNDFLSLLVPFILFMIPAYPLLEKHSVFIDLSEHSSINCALNVFAIILPLTATAITYCYMIRSCFDFPSSALLPLGIATFYLFAIAITCGFLTLPNHNDRTSSSQIGKIVRKTAFQHGGNAILFTLVFSYCDACYLILLVASFIALVRFHHKSNMQSPSSSLPSASKAFNKRHLVLFILFTPLICITLFGCNYFKASSQSTYTAILANNSTDGSEHYWCALIIEEDHTAVCIPALKDDSGNFVAIRSTNSPLKLIDATDERYEIRPNACTLKSSSE